MAIPFEVVEALSHLGERTPSYFKREMFFMPSESTVGIEAAAILKSLEGDGTGTATLCSLMKVIGD